MNKLMTLMTCLLIISTLASSSSWSTTAKPQTCPTVDAIKSIGFSLPRKVLYSFDVYTTINNFGTNNNWQVGLLDLANSRNLTKDQAVAKANTILPTLTFKSGPDFYWQDKYICSYLVDDDSGKKTNVIAFQY